MTSLLQNAGRLRHAVADLAGLRLPRAGPGRHPPQHPGLPQQPRQSYQTAGRLDEAIPLFERTRTDAAQILGDTHPDTLGSRNNLAEAYQAAGRLAEAGMLRSILSLDRNWLISDT
jgi:tetratricopeptide repeat protein